MLSNLNDLKKACFMVNTVLTVLVVVMMVFYYLIGATFLAYYSIPVSFIYFLHYYWIRKYQFVKVTWSTYTMLTLYMFICTIGLGYNYGFQLYAMSTIPLIYHIRYIAKKFKMADPKPNLWSVFIVLSCLISSLYSVYTGPVYHIEGAAQFIFLGLNLSAVCFFLVSFSQATSRLIIESEDKLTRQADFDALTGLANRYYMMSRLEQATITSNPSERIWVAMIDVDNFKHINDCYGHAVGDQVLMILSNLMKKICKDCTISRWGGEEFLVSGNEAVVPSQVMQTLVEQIREREVHSETGSFNFSISVGLSYYNTKQRIDAWINDADKKLYVAKNNGKNQVVR